jgi:hypothetical protein
MGALERADAAETRGDATAAAEPLPFEAETRSR